MKYGIVVYRETKNIGDDIQSYAAAQLLPCVDYYVEREKIDVFRPEEDEPVNVIMNGWFMYNKLAWPVAPSINPLYISMHFCKEDPLEIGADFLEGFGGEDMRLHGPVGCRDRATQKMLEQAGIKTWYSACLTLTLQAKFPKTDERCIYLVDISDEAVEYVKQCYPNESIRIIHQEEEGLVKQEASWEERFANVEKLLTMYQNAKAVVTTRLHCAMPCLGLGTPVLLLHRDSIPEQDRFEGLNELVRHASEADFLAGKADFDLVNPGPNPDGYLVYRQNLSERVRQFVEDNRICTPELKQRYLSYDGEWERRAAWKNELLVRISHKAIERWKEEHQWMDQLDEARRWLSGKNDELETMLREKEKELEVQHSWSEEQEKAKEWLSAKNGELEEALRNSRKELEQSAACLKWLESKNAGQKKRIAELTRLQE